MIGNCRINPSLMCMDFLKIREQLAFFEDKADYLHVDIMDGHFVPNLALSPDFCGRIAKLTKLPLDCHLMVTDPGLYLPMLIKAGAGFFVPHAETLSGQAFNLFRQAAAAGMKLGVAVNPETPIDVIAPYADLLDKVTVMTVDPGFAGQPFVPQMLKKIMEAVSLREACGAHYEIEVDGACNKANYKAMYASGARVFVMGSSGLFGLDEDLAKAWARMERELLSETEGEAR